MEHAAIRGIIIHHQDGELTHIERWLWHMLG
jgi:hypothetical protein